MYSLSLWRIAASLFVSSPSCVVGTAGVPILVGKWVHEPMVWELVFVSIVRAFR